LVLLSGAVRATPWRSEIGRSVLDLPIDRDATLLSQWVHQAAALAAMAGVEQLALQVLVDRSSPMPSAGPALTKQGLLDQVRVERDPEEYRGTAGLLRDLSLRYGDDDYLLVASGSQILMEPLEHLVGVLALRRADVMVVGHDDGTPAGVFWVRCGCLRGIPELGFIDFKEQALPEIASRHQVGVLRHRSIGLPLRTPTEYLIALRKYHLLRHGVEPIAHPFVEDWRPVFKVVEQGAEVHASAEIPDSVVLAGGRVERGAVVVRTVVGPAGVVRRGRTVVDGFVNGPARGKG
jgi:NDP-sugar pyrophosphorylase family protein